MKHTLSFIAFAIVVIGILFLVSGDRSPRIPEDVKHAGLMEDSLCTPCHGPEKEFARKAEHPPKDECLKCHKRKRVVKK